MLACCFYAASYPVSPRSSSSNKRTASYNVLFLILPAIKKTIDFLLSPSVFSTGWAIHISLWFSLYSYVTIKTIRKLSSIFLWNQIIVENTSREVCALLRCILGPVWHYNCFTLNSHRVLRMYTVLQTNEEFDIVFRKRPGTKRGNAFPNLDFCLMSSTSKPHSRNSIQSCSMFSQVTQFVIICIMIIVITIMIWRPA
jgi:hypothetical protein